MLPVSSPPPATAQGHSPFGCGGPSRTFRAKAWGWSKLGLGLRVCHSAMPSLDKDSWGVPVLSTSRGVLAPRFLAV